MDVQSHDALTASAEYHRPSHPAVPSALQRLAVSFYPFAFLFVGRIKPSTNGETAPAVSCAFLSRQQSF